jgi:putative ABC transport system permease protein
MDIRETIAVAIDALRANKLRAMLTSLGVIIGSASVVLVVTVALTSRKFVLSQIEATGANLVWVELVQTPDKAPPRSYEMTADDIEAVKSISHVAAVAGTSEHPMTMTVDRADRAVSLVGVTEGYQTIRRLLIVRGRYFDAGDMEMRSKVCLITTQLAERIFGQENPIGRPIRIGELTFTVIGVFRERVETFGLSEIQENSVLIPFTLMKYYTGTEVVGLLDVQADTEEDVPSVAKQLLLLLHSRHPVEADYKVQTLTAILGAARNISLALTLVLIIIAAIALLISGIGIMNIMLVTVTERTREIGIRKAIGAARQEILYQFLVESFFISGGGAVIGILLGIAVPVAVQSFLPGNLRVPVSPLSVVIAFVVSCSTGLFFGYLPANQAARLQPVESLRYE